MKTMKSILIVTIASAAFSLIAAEPLLSPRATGVKHPVIASGAVKDPSLIAGARLGKNTPPTAALSTGATDANFVAAIADCTMNPKTKDTAACKKHCETFAKK